MHLKRCAFNLDGNPFTLGDAVAASRIGGWLEDHRRRAAGRIAIVGYADHHGIELSSEELQAAVDGWRTARGLITADEMEVWFDEFGLTLEDLVSYCERELLESRLSAKIGEALEAHPPDSAEVVALLVRELTFSSELGETIDAFAIRVAVEPVADAAARADDRARILADVGLTDDATFNAETAVCGVDPARARQLLDIEADFRIRSREVLTPDALAAELEAHPADYLRIEVATAHLADEDIAREVVLCVREDGDPLERAVARAGENVRREVYFPEDLPSLPFAARQGSALPGEIMGPLELNGRFHVALLIARTPGTIAEPAVRERAERHVLESVFRKDVIRRVEFKLSARRPGS